MFMFRDLGIPFFNGLLTAVQRLMQQLPAAVCIARNVSECGGLYRTLTSILLAMQRGRPCSVCSCLGCSVLCCMLGSNIGDRMAHYTATKHWHAVASARNAIFQPSAAAS